jgi:uncharacterized damage-inducible protein DinB
MESFYENYLNNLDELHSEIEEALQGLASAALDWTPQPGMNSIGVMVYHLTGAERYWIGEVVGQVNANRDREAEFRMKGMDADTLLKRLTDNRALIVGVLSGMKLSDLETRRMARNQNEVTVGWALGHALKHTATHLGQIQLTRELWDKSK